jgi:hypothetical protein
MKKIVKHWWIVTDKGKLKYSEKNLSQCHLSTKSPARTSLELKLGLLGEKPVTNCLSQCTAVCAVAECSIPCRR